MMFSNLANELVLHIFQSCASIPDVLALAATCHHFHDILGSAQKLPILYQAAEAQFGPLIDAIQIVTHNTSQPAHHIRTAPLSFALLKQLLQIGIAAQNWEDLYPSTKWKHNFEDRRLLTSRERFRFRRALYRLWLYSRAFHNKRYIRTERTRPQNVLERAALLHNWSTTELAEIEDVRHLIREVLSTQICPSNGTIARKLRKRCPDGDQTLLFNMQPTYPLPTSAFQTHFHSPHLAAKLRASLLNSHKPTHEAGAEGWGDDIPHYYVVEDMLKLDPGQILHLREHAAGKGMVEAYLRDMGDWFENNGETFGQTLEWVVGERGVDVDELREGIEGGSRGVV